MEEPLEVGENWLCQADATRCVGVARVILITVLANFVLKSCVNCCRPRVLWTSETLGSKMADVEDTYWKSL